MLSHKVSQGELFGLINEIDISIKKYDTFLEDEKEMLFSLEENPYFKGVQSELRSVIERINQISKINKTSDKNKAIFDYMVKKKSIDDNFFCIIPERKGFYH